MTRFACFATLLILILPAAAHGAIFFWGDTFPDLDADTWTLATGDLDDMDHLVNPVAPDLDHDGIPDTIDPDSNDAAVPAGFPLADMGLSTGGPYTIAPGEDLNIVLAVATPAFTSATNLKFDLDGDHSPDAWAGEFGLGPFFETIDAAHLAAFGIGGVGTHEIKIGAYGVGVIGTFDPQPLVMQTLSYTVTPEPSTLMLATLAALGLAAKYWSHRRAARRPAFAFRG
jgi:PEP-CTERM motif